MLLVCPAAIARTNLPSVAWKRYTPASLPPTAICLPSGLNANADTTFGVGGGMFGAGGGGSAATSANFLPLVASQRRNMPSKPPAATVLPSALIATANSQSFEPSSFKPGLAVATSHNCTMPLSPALANSLPSGDAARLRTTVPASSVCTIFSADRFHSKILPSAPDDANSPVAATTVVAGP